MPKPINTSDQSFTGELNDPMNYSTDHSSPSVASDNLWSQFIESEDYSGFASSWLALLCSSIDGVTGALVLLGKPDTGPYSPVAFWPDSTYNLQYLVSVAEQSLTGRRGVLAIGATAEDKVQQSRHIAYPLEISGKIHGVIVLDLTDRSEAHLQAVMRQIHWGAAWLEILIRRSNAEESRATIERLAALIEFTARSVQYEKFNQAAMALVNELASRLKCDRVSLGIMKHHTITLLAVSNTSTFQKRSNLVQATESVMEEAIDQQCIIVSPAVDRNADALISRIHDDFVKRHDLAAACTVPLQGRIATFGALFFERSSQPFDPPMIELLRSMEYLLGPILETHWQQEHWFKSGLLRAPLRLLRRITGPEGLALKAGVCCATIIVIALALITTEYRVSAKTVIEGAIQRTIAAPFDGFISTADVRASDIVRQEQLLCTLDARDLTLEKRKWLTVGDQYTKKYRQSIANHERATAQITDAQLKQAEAETALLDEKLVRTKITAPFPGVIISGDLHQRLGSPVQQGEELFKIAPLDQYRVIIQVDERDLAYVKKEQKGALILSSLPNDKFLFVVKRVTPVSVSEEGKSFFRVEAQLEQASDLLRPGMEGIGKIESGRRSLLWIWTHGVVNWIRLKIWEWTP